MQTKAVYTTVPLRFGAYTPFMSLTQTTRAEILISLTFPLPTRIKIRTAALHRKSVCRLSPYTALCKTSFSGYSCHTRSLHLCFTICLVYHKCNAVSSGKSNMTLLRNILCNRQSYADKSTLAKLAVKSHRAAVAVDDMLYYGKAESGTALFGASALIHSVETLKYTVK